jgi:ATP-dependent exoDNAse (exonuclease V) alpha subunit
MLQDKALAILKSGANVFLTGSAGTGKTYVLNSYIAYLKARKVSVAVTASTGIAATHINGMTIHTWSGIGIKSEMQEHDFQALLGKKYLKDNLNNVRVLIVDEISMLHRKQFELVDQVLRRFKEIDESFGGIQVVVSGDFFQLPPIGNNNEQNREKFAFMSQAWVQAQMNVCYLSQQYRQTNNSLNHLLNEIRKNDVSEKGSKILTDAMNHTISDDAPRLFTHNVDVDRVNAAAIKELKGEAKQYKASTKGNAKLVAMLENSVLAPTQLQLKLEAKVMFVKNNPEKGIVNGNIGHVVSFDDEGIPKVKLLDGRTIHATSESWTVNDDKGKVLASFQQLPLRLAWAITVHKSQGMTLDAAQMDLSKTFESGQGYVALSRLKDIEGLSLLGFNNKALEVDTLVVKADKRFQEIASELDSSMHLEVWESLHKSFLTRIGGLTDAAEITKLAKKKADKSQEKIPTHVRTAEFVKKGMSIKEIADERGLGEGTIVSHLGKIKELIPEIDLGKFKPEGEVISQIYTAYAFLKAEADKKTDKPEPSLKELFVKLDGVVDYTTLKLALLFYV